MISLKNITQIFDNGIEKTQVLNRLSLDIPEGQFVTIIGGNGAGKSTLFNIINGKRVYQDPNFGVCPNLTIAENMALANRRGKVCGLSWGLRKKAAPAVVR